VLLEDELEYLYRTFFRWIAVSVVLSLLAYVFVYSYLPASGLLNVDVGR
jgi:hypothetical protein